MTKEHDIVYFVKNSPSNEELRFSLRSVERNFPHRKVWIFGGKPDYIIPDEFVPLKQYGSTKWERVRNMLLKACEHRGITEEFYLFNDDFFIMQPVEQFEQMYDGNIYKRILDVEGRNYDKPTLYTAELRKMLRELERVCPDAPMLNYAVHMPMLVNRRQMLEVLHKFHSPMFRTLYGNYWRIGGTDIKDGKITRNNQKIDDFATYLSSEDTSFATGQIGEYMRKQFKERSKYEQA